MRIETRNDIRLIGRAMKEGWDFDKSKVVEALMEVVERRDPDLMLDAIALLQKGDEINIKREVVELKKLGDPNYIKLRLLEQLGPERLAELVERGSQRGLVGPGDRVADERKGS